MEQILYIIYVGAKIVNAVVDATKKIRSKKRSRKKAQVKLERKQGLQIRRNDRLKKQNQGQEKKRQQMSLHGLIEINHI